MIRTRTHLPAAFSRARSADVCTRLLGPIGMAKRTHSSREGRTANASADALAVHIRQLCDAWLEHEPALLSESLRALKTITGLCDVASGLLACSAMPGDRRDAIASALKSIAVGVPAAERSIEAAITGIGRSMRHVDDAIASWQRARQLAVSVAEHPTSKTTTH